MKDDYKEQLSIPFKNSLNPTPYQIRVGIIKTELENHNRQGKFVSADDIVRINTGLTMHQYLNRPFDQLKCYNLSAKYRNGVDVKGNIWSI